MNIQSKLFWISTFLLLMNALIFCASKEKEVEENGSTDPLLGTPWEGFKEDSIVSSMDNSYQHFFYYEATGQDKKPLVISLHQWSADYTTYQNSLAPETKAKNWNYIRPDFRGSNNHVKACGSDYVIEDIDEAIDWAIDNLPVDTTRIYMYGASGGGHAALCSFMKSRHKINEFSVWVPVTDLKRGYYEFKSRELKYASDILKCTCGDCDKLNVEKVIERSPLYWETPVEKLNYCKINIFTGIHDGHTGSVPIIHSIAFFNKLVASVGGDENDQVSCDEITWMLTARTSPDTIRGKISDRDIHYNNNYKNISLTIFEGGHEVLINSVLPEF